MTTKTSTKINTPRLGNSELARPPGPDAQSRAWIRDLEKPSRRRDEAIERLHEMLLRAARFEVNRRRATLPYLRGNDFEDLATQSADDALVAVLSKLDTYRGDSKFTTWVYKFALLEAGTKLRRRAWQGHEIPLEEEGWARLSDGRGSPDGAAESSELIGAVRDAIAEELTPHQRSVLVALTLNDVPSDVLAERLGTTRGALYKTLHDARSKLRFQLAAQGMTIDQ